MRNLEDLKVDIPDVNKIKTQMADLWNNLVKYNFENIPKNSILSVDDILIIKELFNKTTNETLKEKIYDDLKYYDDNSKDNEQLKSILYALVARVKEQVKNNPKIKIEHIIIGELHHISKQEKENSEKVTIYGE